MTSIPLQYATIRSYLGTTDFNSCQEISRIHLEYNVDRNEAEVEARIPAATTRQGEYRISVRVRPNGSAILGSRCSCPVGSKCKHIFKVLRRVARSSQEPICGPAPGHSRADRRAASRRRSEMLEHASVYLACACKSELDSGSDFMVSMYVKDNYDQEILGVFFSKQMANQCAKEHVLELGYELDAEDNEEDEDLDSDDEENFVWDGSDFGECNDENSFDKVWVERHAIEDASRRFHR